MFISRARTLALVALSIHIVASHSPAFAQGPTAGLSVNVVNSSANPVPVTLLDNPVFQAITITFRDEDGGSGPGGGFVLQGAAYTVPAGKSLVIERVAGEFIVDGQSGFKVKLALAETVPGASSVFHFIGISSETMRCSLGSMCAGIGHQAKIYVAAGHSVRAEGTFDFFAPASRYVFSGTINGYLVDTP